MGGRKKSKFPSLDVSRSAEGQLTRHGASKTQVCEVSRFSPVHSRWRPRSVAPHVWPVVTSSVPSAKRSSPPARPLLSSPAAPRAHLWPFKGSH